MYLSFTSGRDTREYKWLRRQQVLWCLPKCQCNAASTACRVAQSQIKQPVLCSLIYPSRRVSTSSLAQRQICSVCSSEKATGAAQDSLRRLFRKNAHKSPFSMKVLGKLPAFEMPLAWSLWNWNLLTCPEDHHPSHMHAHGNELVTSLGTSVLRDVES